MVCGKVKNVHFTIILQIQSICFLLIYFETSCLKYFMDFTMCFWMFVNCVGVWEEILKGNYIGKSFLCSSGESSSACWLPVLVNIVGCIKNQDRWNMFWKSFLITLIFEWIFRASFYGLTFIYGSSWIPYNQLKH